MRRCAHYRDSARPVFVSGSDGTGDGAFGSGIFVFPLFRQGSAAYSCTVWRRLLAVCCRFCGIFRNSAYLPSDPRRSIYAPWKYPYPVLECGCFPVPCSSDRRLHRIFRFSGSNVSQHNNSQSCWDHYKRYSGSGSNRPAPYQPCQKYRRASA